MKKKIGFFMLYCFMRLAVSAQGQPVIDIAHILETIHVASQTYQQVQNTIKQLEYQYQQSKMQLQNLQKMDFSNINGITDAVSFVDKNLSFIRNTENRLKNTRVQIGKGSYDLASLYKSPNGVFSEMSDLWTRDLTKEEKARIYSRYGLDPKNYYYMQAWNGRVQEGAKKIAVIAEDAEKQFEENGKEVEAIAEKSRASDSTVALLQAQNELLRNLHKELQMLSYTTKMSANLMADKAMAESYSKPEIQLSDDFFKLSPMPDLELKGDR